MIQAVNSALADLVGQVFSFLPNLLGFLVLLLIGYFVSAFFGGITRRLLKTLDTYVEKYELDKMLPMKLSELMGMLVKYFILLVFLVAGADVLGVEAITLFLNDVLRYVPNVFVAIVIIALSMMISKAIAPLIKDQKLSKLAKYAVLVFGALTAMSQLGIGAELLNIVSIGIVAALAIAFGLGAKDKAREYVDKVL